MEVEKKIAIVTGGANGIGFACVTELLRNGVAHVAILDLANSNGEGAAEKLNDEFGKGKAIFVICDVTKAAELEAGFAKTVKEFGGLDIVINNAGIVDCRRWDLMVDINFTAVVRGTLLGLQHMGKDKGGRGGTIINISSVGGILPFSTFPIYCATKHAVVGLSRSFALPLHYERTDVRILTICPGLTDTKLAAQSTLKATESISLEEVIKVYNQFPTQTTEVVAQGVLHVIRIGETGSVWVAEDGKPVYEIEVPDQFVKKVRD